MAQRLIGACGIARNGRGPVLTTRRRGPGSGMVTQQQPDNRSSTDAAARARNKRMADLQRMGQAVEIFPHAPAPILIDLIQTEAVAHSRGEGRLNAIFSLPLRRRTCYNPPAGAGRSPRRRGQLQQGAPAPT